MPLLALSRDVSFNGAVMASTVRPSDFEVVATRFPSRHTAVNGMFRPLRTVRRDELDVGRGDRSPAVVTERSPNRRFPLYAVICGYDLGRRLLAVIASVIFVVTIGARRRVLRDGNGCLEASCADRGYRSESSGWRIPSC